MQKNKTDAGYLKPDSNTLHTMSDTAVHPADTPTPPPAAPKRPAWWKRLAAAVLLTPALLLGALAWLTGTESGLRFGLTRIPAWFGVNIAIQELDGTLWRGFEGRGIQVAVEEADIGISRLSLNWQPQALWQRQLHIRKLAAGDIHIAPKAVPPREASPPPQLPRSIGLPVGVQIDALEVGRVSSGSPDNTLLLPSSLSYRYDHQHHRLHIAALRTPWHEFTGEADLATAPPFALNAGISGQGDLQGQAATSAAAFHGSLEAPHLHLQLKGSGDAPAHFVLRGELRPFEAQLNRKIARLNLEGRHLNPAAFDNSLPEAELVFNLAVEPAEQADTLAGTLEFRNHRPAGFDQHGIPVAGLNGGLHIDTQGRLQVQNLEALLAADGRLTVNGTIDAAAEHNALLLDAAVSQFKVQDVVRQTLPFVIDGTIAVRGGFDNPEARWDLRDGQTAASGLFRLLTDRENRQQSLRFEDVRIAQAAGGELTAQADIGLFQQQPITLQVASRAFNPAAVMADLPEGSVNGNIDLNGTLAEGSDLKLKMHWHDSRLSDAPLGGKAELSYRNGHLPQALINLTLGRNRIQAKGSFGKAGDKLHLNIDAPHLNLFGFGLAGYLKAQGILAGEPARLTADLRGQADGLAVRDALRIRRLDFNLKASPDLNQPLNIQLDGRQIQIGGSQIDLIDLKARGSGRQHNLSGQASLQLDGKPYRLHLAAAGGLNEQHQWRGRVNRLDIGGAFNLKLLNPIQLEAGAQRVALANARWSAMRGSLNLQNFVWDAQSGITTKGSAGGLHLEEIDNLLQTAQAGQQPPAVKHNLVIGGDWDIRYGQNATGYLKLRQQSGDMVIAYRQQALGLKDTVLDTRFHSGRIDNRLTGQTRYGTVDAAVAVSQTFGSSLLAAPVSGYLKIQVPDLDNLRYLMPAGMSAKGRLAIDTAVSGTVGEPRLNGTAKGSGLHYRDRNTGVILDNGSLLSRFQGRDWLIDSLAFKRKDGSVALKGRVNLTGTTPDVNVSALFSRYQILDTPNRKLTLSGDAALLYTPQRGIALSGTLKADSGHFGFQKSGMPGLDDDVVVLGEEPTVQAEAPPPIALNLELDLNDNFRFSGEGLDVMLGGKLTVTAQPKEDIRAVGTVNIVRGQYKAYGQDLLIEKGTISFVGPLSDPNLNLRAVRKLSPVGAGVEVLGNLSNPRVSLIANEPMSDKDKLTWLILGRASSGNESDEAAVAAAAGAFLAGNVNDKLGLVDDFGMTTRRTRNTQTGELNPAEQIITFGKRLSNELYLGYEYSVTSANQAVKLIWQINASLQAIARVGTDSVGGEARYTIRFD